MDAVRRGVSALKRTPIARASADRPSALSEESAGGWGSTLLLGALFGAWYLFNIYFNIYNKQVLKAYPYPLTVTAFQFLVGSALSLSMWGLGLHARPVVDGAVARALSPLALVHTLGNALTNVSLGAVAVSFTHTIKALEPLFSVVLSSLFLGDAPNAAVILSLVPIVGGVALASTSELSFNWTGFLSAMGSNLTFQSRNVLSKKFMGGAAKETLRESRLDNVNLFSVMTLMAFCMLAPLALFLEAPPLTPAAVRHAALVGGRAAAALDPIGTLLWRALAAAVCFHAYQQVSYAILARVTPVTHSVGNCVKRVVVIVTSVIIFRNPVTPQNALGTGIALAGVFFYSQVKRLATPKTKTA